MDHNQYITERVKGQHLKFEQRCEIKCMLKNGYSVRQIARYLNCSPQTVSNEIKRGTKVKTTNKGRPTEYSSKRGQDRYDINRKNCGRKSKHNLCRDFFKWTVDKILKDGWSLDACAGYAKKNNLFKGKIACTKTLYNALHKGMLEISLFDVPELLSRSKRKRLAIKNKRIFGKSIDDRPKIVTQGTEFGHWEIDTVIGKKQGVEAVVLTILEKMTHELIAIKINRKDAKSVLKAFKRLEDFYGKKLSQVFKTITADNGSEFAELSILEEYGISVYFTHPYSSWERPQNERHNRLLRKYLPKGKSIESYSDEEIQWFADAINSVPRRSLNYATADEMFEKHLDQIYAA